MRWSGGVGAGFEAPPRNALSDWTAPEREVGGHDKSAEYAELVAARKVCHRCPGLKNPADVPGGLDSDHIGPWSIWQGNLDASVMVVGQDWGDVAYFVAHRGRDVAHNFTNRALVELLDLAGVTVQPLDAPELRNVAFFTNAILCLKSGGLQGTVSRASFEKCRPFLRRQIEIVRPQVVVGLGERAYRSILEEFGVAAQAFRQEVEAAEGRSLPNGARTFAVYHCGARIRNTHRTLDEQQRDWQRIRAFVRKAD